MLHRLIVAVGAGAAAALLFVVSSRLRVSEEVLEETDEAALYVYKGRINARSVVRHADALAARP